MSQYVTTMPNCSGCCLQEANGDWEKSCFVFGKLGEALNDTEAAVERLSALLPDVESEEMVRDYILPNMRVNLVSIGNDLGEMWTDFQAEIYQASCLNGVEVYESVSAAVEKNATEFAAAMGKAFELFNK